MSVDRKLMDHFINTPMETIAEGMKLGERAAAELGAGEGGQLLGRIIGMFAGATAGGARILNPLDAVSTLGRTNEEIDKRSEVISQELGR